MNVWCTVEIQSSDSFLLHVMFIRRYYSCIVNFFICLVVVLFFCNTCNIVLFDKVVCCKLEWFGVVVFDEVVYCNLDFLMTCFIFSRCWTTSGFLKCIYVNVNVHYRSMFKITCHLSIS
jgi:hypothetical protein